MFQIKLKELRENIGISQYQFAKKLGVAQSTVGGWESGKREPNFTTMQSIADFFGVTVDYLLGRTDQREPTKPEFFIEFETHEGDIRELLETIRMRPEMKALFSLSKKATKEDIEKTVKIIEALKGD